MHQFNYLLRVASSHIPANYFYLPIDGADAPIYRERVYCYELYHQLRSVWPAGCAHSLGGEVDKAGHPLVRGNGLDRAKPDLLVHIPGNMGGNYAVLEIKPCTATVVSLQADIATCVAFTTHAQYQRGLCLIYGRSSRDRALALRTHLAGFGEQIEIWIHENVGSPAEQVG